MALDTLVEIETPEHIVFSHRVAGPARRMVAHVLDLIICYAVVVLVAVVVVFALVGTFSLGGTLESALKFGIGLLLLLLFIAQWVYFVVWEALTGRTPGKKALGLRVVTTAGRPIGFAAAALRNVLRAADLLPSVYLLGVATMLVSSRFQRIGDLVAGTLVVVPDKVRAAGAQTLMPPIQPDEAAALPAEVALDADERAALELFLRRRGTLGHAREYELACMIAGRLAARHGFRGVPDPSRTLALLYDRAVNAGRSEAPSSSREGFQWR